MQKRIQNFSGLAAATVLVATLLAPPSVADTTTTIRPARDFRAESIDNNLTAQAQAAFKAALTYLESTQIKQADALNGDIRLQGEWPAYVRGSLINDGQLTAIYDSNAFVPMFVTYPLLALDDASLPAEAQRIRQMKQRALKLLAQWYVNNKGEVNFWPTIAGFHGPQQIFAASPAMRALKPVFDIANDADDTAVYSLTTLKLLQEFPAWREDLGIKVDTHFGQLFSAWRDQDRVRSDSREGGWKPKHSGAFMTWLDDEEHPYNRLPIAFHLPNNVDCIVTANVLYALGVNEQISGTSRNIPGYEESCALARDILSKRNYPSCAHYYPAEWFFPYVATRAYADGGNSCLAFANDRTSSTSGSDFEPLIQHILSRQIQAGPHAGSWHDASAYGDMPSDAMAAEREFQGTAHVFSTALNLVTLYNLDAQDRPEVRAAIVRGLQYILANATTESGQTFWQGGVFFSSSIKEIARWKSRPYTTAVVLEALTKYLRDPANGGSGQVGRWLLNPADIPSSWQ